MTQKLQEAEREYETTRKALFDKDSLLTLKTASMHMLQKQVRDLRNRSATKDAALQRAAQLLEQYQHTMLITDISAAAVSSSNTRKIKAKASLANKPALLSLSCSGPVDALGASRGSTQRLLGASLNSMPSIALQSTDEVMAKKSHNSLALQRLSEVLRPHLTATATAAATANPGSDASYDVSDQP